MQTLFFFILIDRFFDGNTLQISLTCRWIMQILIPRNFFSVWNSLKHKAKSIEQCHFNIFKCLPGICKKTQTLVKRFLIIVNNFTMFIIIISGSEVKMNASIILVLLVCVSMATCFRINKRRKRAEVSRPYF